MLGRSFRPAAFLDYAFYGELQDSFRFLAEFVVLPSRPPHNSPIRNTDAACVSASYGLSPTRKRYRDNLIVASSRAWSAASVAAHGSLAECVGSAVGSKPLVLLLRESWFGISGICLSCREMSLRYCTR